MLRRWVIAIVILAGFALWAWPYAGAYSLANAAARHDSQALSERIDFPALRHRLARQIVRTYLRKDPRAGKLGGLGRSLAMGVGTTVAEPYLADLVSPDTLTTLLASGKLKPVTAEGRTISWNGTVPNLADALNHSVLAVLLSSYYDGLTSFRIGGLTDGQGADLALHLQLEGGTWKLGGIELPQPVLDRIADDIIAKQNADKSS